MQSTDEPNKIVLPFANSGAKRSIPVASQVGIIAGAASYTDGFPPLTRTPVTSGGKPPSGIDLNGILYEVSAIIRWANAGVGYVYDSTFANDANVGGYPKGARVMRSDGLGYWFNTVNNNVTDPEGSGAVAAGWVPDYTTGVTAITMTSSSVTLTALEYGKSIIAITGTLTANLNLIFPSIAGEWAVINNTTGAYNITCKTASGTGVVVVGSQAIFGDGTNIYNASGTNLSVASTGEAQNWTIDTKLITPLRLSDAFKGANQALNQNGYQTFPGGAIVQWGHGTSSGTSRPNAPVTYPIAFPTLTAAFIIIPQNNSALYQGMSSSAPTASGASGLICSDTTIYSGVNYNWIAMGY